LLAASRYVVALALVGALAGLLVPSGPVEVAHAQQATTTYSSGDINTVIPDNNVNGTLAAVGDAGTVLDVNVRVRINHPYTSDLGIVLLAPDNSTVALAVDEGGEGDNFGSGATSCSGTFTTFDDQAGATIVGAAAPFAGSFRPGQALAGFNGKQAAGTWRLFVRDTEAEDVGTLYCWQLEITRSTAPATTNTPTATPTLVPTATATPIPQADLGITLTDAPDPVRTGTNVGYTATVTNNGPSVATGVVATVNLPGDVAFVSASATQGSCSRSGTVVTCNLGTLGAGATATATVIVTAPAIASGTTSFTATASVRNDVADPNAGNNSAVQTTTANSCAPRPTVTQTVVQDGSGRVRVSIASTTTAGASTNRVRAIRFDSAPNARVEVNGQQRTVPSTVTLPDGPTQVDILVSRIGAGAFTANFVVIDDCGERPSFAGGGANVP